MLDKNFIEKNKGQISRLLTFLYKLSFIPLILIGIRILAQFFFNLDDIIFLKNVKYFVIIFVIAYLIKKMLIQLNRK
jgi:hypothetical protein